MGNYLLIKRTDAYYDYDDGTSFGGGWVRKPTFRIPTCWQAAITCAHRFEPHILVAADMNFRERLALRRSPAFQRWIRRYFRLAMSIGVVVSLFQ